MPEKYILEEKQNALKDGGSEIELKDNSAANLVDATKMEDEFATNNTNKELVK